jgi:hypothetical protein
MPLSPDLNELWKLAAKIKIFSYLTEKHFSAYLIREVHHENDENTLSAKKALINSFIERLLQGGVEREEALKFYEELNLWVTDKLEPLVPIPVKRSRSFFKLQTDTRAENSAAPPVRRASLSGLFSDKAAIADKSLSFADRAKSAERQLDYKHLNEFLTLFKEVLLLDWPSNLGKRDKIPSRYTDQYQLIEMILSEHGYVAISRPEHQFAQFKAPIMAELQERKSTFLYETFIIRAYLSINENSEQDAADTIRLGLQSYLELIMSLYERDEKQARLLALEQVCAVYIALEKETKLLKSLRSFLKEQLPPRIFERLHQARCQLYGLEKNEKLSVRRYFQLELRYVIEHLSNDEASSASLQEPREGIFAQQQNQILRFLAAISSPTTLFNEFACTGQISHSHMQLKCMNVIFAHAQAWIREVHAIDLEPMEQDELLHKKMSSSALAYCQIVELAINELNAIEKEPRLIRSAELKMLQQALIKSVCLTPYSLYDENNAPIEQLMRQSKVGDTLKTILQQVQKHLVSFHSLLRMQSRKEILSYKHPEYSIVDAEYFPQMIAGRYISTVNKFLSGTSCAEVNQELTQSARTLKRLFINCDSIAIERDAALRLLKKLPIVTSKIEFINHIEDQWRVAINQQLALAIEQDSYKRAITQFMTAKFLIDQCACHASTVQEIDVQLTNNLLHVIQESSQKLHQLLRSYLASWDNEPLEPNPKLAAEGKVPKETVETGDVIPVPNYPPPMPPIPTDSLIMAAPSIDSVDEEASRTACP